MVEGTILLLGSGMCAPPLVEYLAKAGFRLVIATRTTSKTESIVAKTGKVDIPIEVVKYDIEEDFKKDLISLDELVHRVDPDVLVSLLPWIYHVPAAKLALKKKKHFCTASYVSEDMQALDDDVKKAGLFFLNECGVDPGLDHMSAMRIIDQVKAKGGKIISFKSICGGLPAPDYNDNPLGYKLSWSPRGVLLASNNNALIRMNGEQIEVKGENLFEEKNCHTLVEESLGDLEWYYNRDSVKYGDIYNIADSKTIIRGTFRFPGWCRMMDAFKRLGVTSLDSIAELKGLSAFEATKIVLSCKDLNPQDFISSQLKLSTDDDIIKRLEWLGMFDNSLIVDQSVQTPLDFMSWLFERSLVYASGEKDMIVMRHEFEVEYEHKHREQIISSLIDFGLQPDNYSSMARTVSLPLAVAIKSFLEGKIKVTGVIRPIQPGVYNIILDEMESLGIVFSETVSPVHIWIRAETKTGEERVALTPNDASILIQKGFKISVEKSSLRAFRDDQYSSVGANIVPFGSWKTNAPLSALILGLKELEDNDPPSLLHRHIFFAHCFKDQEGWKELLHRFKRGNGLLWDLEFLVDDNKRRVAAFGRAAGVVGAALGLLTWALKHLGENVPPMESWRNSAELVEFVRLQIKRASSIVGRSPKILVLGAKGRCGGGASWFARQAGVDVIEWDLEETKNGGPFTEFLDVDVLLNAIYLTSKIPPFLTEDLLARRKDRKLSVFVDVSCDSNNPNNPFPIYSGLTSLSSPVLSLDFGGAPLHIIAIDHLPTLIPSESSSEFSAALLPHLLDLAKPEKSPVWDRAEDIFRNKLSLAEN